LREGSVRKWKGWNVLEGKFNEKDGKVGMYLKKVKKNRWKLEKKKKTSFNVVILWCCPFKSKRPRKLSRDIVRMELEPSPPPLRDREWEGNREALHTYSVFILGGENTPALLRMDLHRQNTYICSHTIKYQIWKNTFFSFSVLTIFPKCDPLFFSTNNCERESFFRWKESKFHGYQFYKFCSTIFFKLSATIKNSKTLTVIV